MKLIDIKGIRFGKLVVLERDLEKKGLQTYWKCLCDCGEIVTETSFRLRNGKVKSCEDAKREPYGRLEKGEASFNMLFRNYKGGAKRRGLPFELKKEEFRRLTKDDCHYCGKSPQNEITKEDRGYSNGTYIYNGVDRIDNLKGYTIENCVTCCGNCNNAKKKMDKREFLEWIKCVYRHSIEKDIKG